MKRLIYSIIRKNTEKPRLPTPEKRRGTAPETPFCVPVPAAEEKNLRLQHADAQHGRKNFPEKRKKMFVGLKIGCIFAPAFDEKTAPCEGVRKRERGH